MKNKFKISLIYFVLSYNLIQVKSVELEMPNLILEKDTLQTSYSKNKNLFNIDGGFLYSISPSYARRISEKWYLGGGIGLGPSLNWSINWNEYIFELAHIRMPLVYVHSKNFQLESGLQASLNQWGGKGEEEGLFGGVYGLYLLPAVGFNHFKVGFKVLIGLLDFYYRMYYITPLILRIGFTFN